MALQQQLLYLYTSPELNILGTLSLNVEKTLTLIGDVKMIFKLQNISFSIKIFWSFFWIWKKVLSKNGNLMKTLTVCSYHVTYAFQSESTLYSCVNVKKLLVRSRRAIWRLGDCNWTRTQNHLVRKPLGSSRVAVN